MAATGLFLLLLVSSVSCRPSLETVFYRQIQQMVEDRDRQGVDMSQRDGSGVKEKGGQEWSSTTEEEEESRRRPDIPREVTDWPDPHLRLGQVSGVSVNSQGQPVVFHRGPRVWDMWSFNSTNNFLQIDEGPIQENTILTLDPKTGRVVHEWGSGMFYMPHGITIDHHNNYWLTDVALHQAFKFKPGDLQPILSFGVRFQPGSGSRHLCKPTSVAVASTGELFIADGYCNQRVLKYNAAGGLLRIIPNPPEFLSLQVPHGLALLERWDRLCVADRENRRVVCVLAGLRSLPVGEPASALTIQEPDLGRVFAVAAKGDLIYAVNGYTSPLFPVRGFTIDPRAETIVDHWGPAQGLKNPHAIAISPNGTEMYVAEIGPNKIWKFNLVPQSNELD